MVAYSFKRMFADPIVADEKLHTVRAYRENPHASRRDTRGHARPGEELQLYVGMRTSSCKLIGRRTCKLVEGISFSWQKSIVLIGGLDVPKKKWRQLDNYGGAELDQFARADGFKDWKALWDFWHKNHGDADFEGAMIHWHPSTWPKPVAPL